MMKPLAFVLSAFALMSISTAAFADDTYGGTSEAPAPRSVASPVRLLPVVGQSSFTTQSTVSTQNFSGFSAGLLGDFGSDMWNFETGVLSLNSTQVHSDNNASISVNTWGIPLLAKLNLSGHPHQTVFFKGGVMPFNANGGAASNFDVMGVGGIGGDIPLGRNSSIVLDASYNRLFTNSGNLTNYQGIALLAGLSLNI